MNSGFKWLWIVMNSGKYGWGIVRHDSEKIGTQYFAVNLTSMCLSGQYNVSKCNFFCFHRCKSTVFLVSTLACVLRIKGNKFAEFLITLRCCCCYNWLSEQLICVFSVDKLNKHFYFVFSQNMLG